MPTFHVLADVEVVVTQTIDMIIDAEDGDDARVRARNFLQTQPKGTPPAKRFLPLKERRSPPSSIRLKKVQEVYEETAA